MYKKVKTKKKMAIQKLTRNVSCVFPDEVLRADL